MSPIMFRAEVEVADGSPAIWYANAVRFEDREAAVAYVKDLSQRWTLVRRGRVVEDSVPRMQPVDPNDENIVVSYC
jgi:hypothetical protein